MRREIETKTGSGERGAVSGDERETRGDRFSMSPSLKASWLTGFISSALVGSRGTRWGGHRQFQYRCGRCSNKDGGRGWAAVYRRHSPEHSRGEACRPVARHQEPLGRGCDTMTARQIGLVFILALLAFLTPASVRPRAPKGLELWYERPIANEDKVISLGNYGLPMVGFLGVASDGSFLFGTTGQNRDGQIMVIGPDKSVRFIPTPRLFYERQGGFGSGTLLMKDTWFVMGGVVVGMDGRVLNSLDTSPSTPRASTKLFKDGLRQPGMPG